MIEASAKGNLDDIRLLLGELSEIKELLRETSRQVLRIERRVKAVLPQQERSQQEKRSHVSSSLRPKMSEESARGVINQLKERLSQGEQIESRLREYAVRPELEAIASILGMTNAALPPKDELVRRISTRIRQGVSVTTGIQNKPDNNN